MRFSFPRRGHLAAIFTGIVIAAGCSSSSPAVQGFVYATIEPTSGGSCAGIATVTPFLQIGTMGTDGTGANRVGNNSVTNISCDVKGSGSTYSFSLSATAEGTMTGSMTMSGSGISSTTAGGDISGTFLGTLTQGQYTGKGCTLTLSNPEGTGGIAPGRVWGRVECDAATNGSVSVNGGASVCNITVDFVFENCSS